MAYGGSNDDVINYITWPWKVKVVIPNPNIFKARYFKNGSRWRLGFNGAPSPSPSLYKSCKKFTWRIYALSERLLVMSSYSCSFTSKVNCSYLDCVHKDRFQKTHFDAYLLVVMLLIFSKRIRTSWMRFASKTVVEIFVIGTNCNLC